MTAVVEETETGKATEAVSPNDLAGWHLRAGALAIDIVPSIAVAATLGLTATALTMSLRSAWFWLGVSPWFWLGVSLIGLVILLTVNRWLIPTITGWSLGRAVVGITVVRRDGSSAGPGRLLLRDLGHMLDTLSLFVGWLWPLWDSRRRTFADMLLRTEVRRMEPPRSPRNLRRLTAVLMLTAALVCTGGAAVSYSVVYQRDRAIDQTRAELAARGPKIVEELLTYDPSTLKDDFARAQSLATEKYREQLVAQQQAAEKAGPVTNEYWVTNSSVLSPVTPDRATMLLFLQGQRGDPERRRAITATVRVAFVKSADDRWLVDDLTVVTKPQSPVGEG